MGGERRVAAGLVRAVVVVGVVGLTDAPVAARGQRAERQPSLIAEISPDAAHRRGLARHPDPRSVRDLRGAGRRVEFRAEGPRVAPVMPRDRRLGRTVLYETV